jgi:flagellar hook-basal body complex protein FliE
MSLEFKTDFGTKEVIKTMESKNIPEGSIEKIMNFFNQPGYKSITREEAIDFIIEFRKDIEENQKKTEAAIIEMQTGQASENEVMDLGQTAS